MQGLENWNKNNLFFVLFLLFSLLKKYVKRFLECGWRINKETLEFYRKMHHDDNKAKVYFYTPVTELWTYWIINILTKEWTNSWLSSRPAQGRTWPPPTELLFSIAWLASRSHTLQCNAYSRCFCFPAQRSGWEIRKIKKQGIQFMYAAHAAKRCLSFCNSRPYETFLYSVSVALELVSLSVEAARQCN